MSAAPAYPPGAGYTRRAPDAEAVVHEQLQAGATPVGEEVAVVDLRGAEDSDHLGEKPFGAATHVDGLDGHGTPDAVVRQSRRPRDQASGAPGIDGHDEALETEAGVAEHVVGLLTSVAAAPHIRSGRLVPLLVERVVDQSNVFVYDGSRPAQPARVRAFIEVTVELQADNPAFVLTAEELKTAENAGRAATKRLAWLMRAVGPLSF